MVEYDTRALDGPIHLGDCARPCRCDQESTNKDIAETVDAEEREPVRHGLQLQSLCVENLCCSCKLMTHLELAMAYSCNLSLWRTSAAAVS